MSDADKGGLTVVTPPIHIKAGPQHLAIAFVARQAGPLVYTQPPLPTTRIDSRYGAGFAIRA